LDQIIGPKIEADLREEEYNMQTGTGDHNIR
jgi:hypothetical protein